MAQAEVGVWHEQNLWIYLNQQSRDQLQAVGVRADDQLAYMWISVAESNGADPTKLPLKSSFTSGLTTEATAQAEPMARDWKLGECPSAEHRLGLPGKKV